MKETCEIADECVEVILVEQDLFYAYHFERKTRERKRQTDKQRETETGRTTNHYLQCWEQTLRQLKLSHSSRWSTFHATRSTLLSQHLPRANLLLLVNRRCPLLPACCGALVPVLMWLIILQEQQGTFRTPSRP